VKAGGVADELEWWRAHRASPVTDDIAMRDLLERLRAWKAQHDQDRGRQLGFLRMAWDAVFGDEDEQVAEAIRQLEEALASS
jgi:hypothetical protein